MCDCHLCRRHRSGSIGNENSDRDRPGSVQIRLWFGWPRRTYTNIPRGTGKGDRYAVRLRLDLQGSREEHLFPIAGHSSENTDSLVNLGAKLHRLAGGMHRHVDTEDSVPTRGR